MIRAVSILAFSLLLSLPAFGQSIRWEKLPPIPDEYGFAGPYAGVIGGTLFLAGGANFPEAAPWKGGKKQWHDRVFLLEPGAEAWTETDLTLPQPLAYGVSLSFPHQEFIVLLGGSDGENAPTRTAQLVTLDFVELLPELPIPLAESSGAAVGNVIYLFSGRTADGSSAPIALRLDLDAKPQVWEELPWPGGARGRVHSFAGVQGGKIYLGGGRTPSGDIEHPASDQVLGLDFLRDGYRLDPATDTWTRIADLPHGLSAAPATAVPAGNAHLLVLGGVDAAFLREQVAARPEINGQGTTHPGFPATVWAYHTVTDTWTAAEELPVERLPDHETNRNASTWAPVTVPVVELGGGAFVIPSGEIKPGIRTTQVLRGTITPNRASLGVVNWTVISLYLLGMVAVGYWFMKRESASSTEAYFRGGQRIPWWVAGLSIFATMLSAITFMAIPAKAYAGDLNYWIGQWAIFLIVPLVVVFYLPFFRKLDITTAYEFLEQRFNLACRLVSSALFMFFHVGRVAIVLYLPALALSSATSINIYVAILAIGLLCIVYTVMGGIEAVVWTDAIQALVLIGGALLCLVLIILRIDGGMGTILEIARADSKLLTVDWGSLDLSASTRSGIVIFLGFLFASLPSYTAGQDVVQRYVTTPSQAAAARSLWMNIPMVLFGSLLFFSLGTALYAFYKTQPALLDPTLERNDGILPFFILQNLPVGVAGLIVAGIFAAAQSTISSSLNSVATAYVTDFYGRVQRPDSDDAQRLGVARWIVIGLGIVGIGLAAWIAATGMKSAFDAFNTFIGMALGPVGGLFFLGVFTRRPGGKAALLGALIGFLVVLGVHFLRQAGSLDLWPLLNGFISFTTTVVVGWLLGRAMPSEKAEVAV